MLKVIVTFDTDANNACNRNWEMNDVRFDYEAELTDLFRYFADEQIPSHAFVRIDNQVAEKFEDLYVYELVRRCREDGGAPRLDLNWHPHFFAKKDGQYCVEIDEQKMVQELREVYSRVEAVRSMRAVRIGCTQGGNEIIRCLDECGFALDSTAFPGARRIDQWRHYDWSQSTNHPYYPSKKNYQVQDQDNYNILEIPITAILFKAPYDSAPKLRAINPLIRHEIFADAIDRSMSELTELGFCVVLFHPDELIEGYEDDLYRYGLKHFRQNLSYLRGKIDVTFHMLDELHAKDHRRSDGSTRA